VRHFFHNGNIIPPAAEFVKSIMNNQKKNPAFLCFLLVIEFFALDKSFEMDYNVGNALSGNRML